MHSANVLHRDLKPQVSCQIYHKCLACRLFILGAVFRTFSLTAKATVHWLSATLVSTQYVFSILMRSWTCSHLLMPGLARVVDRDRPEKLSEYVATR
jgi:hypothetical protein